jgi:uncharacterized coiled-coil protein SlyX
LYQQLNRTLQDLTASIAELQQQGALSQDRVRALLTVVGELKLRKEAP